jgi:glycerol-3-phosphate dehydrogenase
VGIGTGDRAAALRRLTDQRFDVLVVGAGATGAATARDAALRGLRVALCDRGDFGGETSAHSSKLIHGGIRYLEQGHLPLVFEALRERRRLMSTAPHLCRPVEFVFPVYRGEDPSLLKLSVGVALYDALALWRPPVSSRRLAPAQLSELAPLLRTPGLRGAVAYVDCQTDDTRLVLENVLDAEAAGALALSRLEIAPPTPRRGRDQLLEAHDRESGRRLTIRARAVVNATGPFSDAFRGRGRALRPTLGVHIVVDARRLPTDGRAFVIRSPRDHRVMFVLPDGLRTVVGTTDTDWPPGDRPVSPDDDIRAHPADVAYLLEAANHAFPGARLEPADVLSTYAGLRPLLVSDARDPSATSREHAIWVDERGVLTVAGGKLTTMRSMGEETVDRLLQLLRDRGYDEPVRPCVTRTRPLPGGRDREPPETGQPAPPPLHELSEDVRRHLQAAYGSRARQVMSLALTMGPEGLHRRLVPELPCLTAEVLFAIRHEHARDVEDVLRRRLPIFRLDREQGLGCAPAVADLLSAELGWDARRRDRSLQDYQAAVERSRCWRNEWRPAAPLSGRSPATP